MNSSANNAANNPAHAPARNASRRRACGVEVGACQRSRTSKSRTAPNAADEKRQAHVLFEEHGNASQRTGGKRKGSAFSSIELRKHSQRDYDPETAVAIVFRIGHDAIDAEENERRGGQQRQRPRSGHTPAQRGKRDPPRQHRAEAAGDCNVENMVKKDPARQADDCGLHEKSERRVRQGKVAIGHLAESDALRGVEDIAEIEEHRDVRVLPKHHAGGRGKKRRSREPVAQRPARGGGFGLRRIRFCWLGNSAYHPR